MHTLGTPVHSLDSPVHSVGAPVHSLGAFVHSFGASVHTAINHPRYTNMGIKYAYPEPTKTFLVSKTTNIEFCQYSVHSLCSYVHSVHTSVHTTINHPTFNHSRYVNMGIKYAYPEPTNTFLVSKTRNMEFCA